MSSNPGNARHMLLLRPREAAQALAISERTLWGLTKTGTIPCVRLGRSVRYDVADLREAIAARKAGGADG